MKLESREFLKNASINLGLAFRVEANPYGMHIDQLETREGMTFFADLNRDEMIELRDMLDRVLETPMPRSASGVMYEGDGQDDE